MEINKIIEILKSINGLFQNNKSLNREIDEDELLVKKFENTPPKLLDVYEPETRNIFDTNGTFVNYKTINKSLFASIGLLILFFGLFFILKLSIFGSKVAGIVCIAIFVFSCVSIIKNYIKYKNYLKGLFKLKETCSMNRDTIEYNNINIVSDIEKYNNDVMQNNLILENYEKELNEKKEKHMLFVEESMNNIKENNNRIDEYKKQLESMNCRISDNYFNELDKIINILDSGRADSLKEALNILESDRHNQKLIQLQEEENERAELHRVQMAEEQRAHNIQMQKYQNELLNEQRENNRINREALQKNNNSNNPNYGICVGCKNAGRCMHTPNGGMCVHRC